MQREIMYQTDNDEQVNYYACRKTSRGNSGIRYSRKRKNSNTFSERNCETSS